MAEVLSAGPFATQGERRAAQILRGLPDHWLVICNKMLATNDGRTYEIDFIVLGERWVFVIDEKSWRGVITGNDQRWFRSDNFSERSPLSKADTIARPLAGHLRSGTMALRENIGQWVRGGVLLSIGDQIPDIQDPRAKDGIFLLSDVCNRLQELDRKGGTRDIGRARDEIKACLLGLPARPAMPGQIGLYIIDEIVSERGGTRIFQATMDGAGPRILHVYDLGRDPVDTDELRTFYMREFGALQQLRHTGLVPEVQDPFPWSDEFLVVPVTPPSGTSLGTRPAPETADGFVDELHLAAAAFSALQRIHEHGVLHRALGPEAIFVAPEIQSPSVIFTSFFAARINQKRTIVMSLDALTHDDPYAAPELVAGYGSATNSSDTWSLGLIFLERFAGESVSALRKVTANTIAIPDLAVRWPSLPSEVTKDLANTFNSLLTRIPSERLSASAASAAFNDLTYRLRAERHRVERGIFDSRYKIERQLGEGAMARTYLVIDSEFGGLFAVKQFLRPSAVYEQATYLVTGGGTHSGHSFDGFGVTERAVLAPPSCPAAAVFDTAAAA